MILMMIVAITDWLFLLNIMCDIITVPTVPPNKTTLQAVVRIALQQASQPCPAVGVTTLEPFDTKATFTTSMVYREEIGSQTVKRHSRIICVSVRSHLHGKSEDSEVFLLLSSCNLSWWKIQGTVVICCSTSKQAVNAVAGAKTILAQQTTQP